jgi:ABC-2 type transport system permease protein
MLVLIVYVFTLSVYTRATAMPDTLNKAPIAIVDEDRSPLSTRITTAFYPPYFLPPRIIHQAEMDARMDAGLDTFALDIPPDFQRDVLAGRAPAIQLNVDATRMSQAFTGSGYVQSIVDGEVRAFVSRYRAVTEPPVRLTLRPRFNPELNKSWFAAIMAIISEVTMLSIVLTGAALIREREHGTVEHLLVMPVTPLEIMLGKVWSMGLVVLVAATLSLVLVVDEWLQVPLQGSLALFVAGAAVHLFATTAMGIFLGTIARSMPQLGLLYLLVYMPLNMLSGGFTPLESMPPWLATAVQISPTVHFVAFAQAILYRGAGFMIVWPQFAVVALIGGVFLLLALWRFRSATAAG